MNPVKAHMCRRCQLRVPKCRLQIFTVQRARQKVVCGGIGQALLEACSYDPSGQLLSGSYMDYTMPRANDIPNLSVATENTMCTHNPLGSKGCGEVGAIGSPPAVINAVVDALKDYGVRHLDMPATGAKLWSIIHAAQPRMAAE